jgi:hypothetical protein
MDSLQAFKLAFFNRCAEEGLTVEQIHHRVKTALHRIEKSAGENSGAPEGMGVAKNLALGTGAGWLWGEADPTATAVGAGLGAAQVPEMAWNIAKPSWLLALAGLTGAGVLGGKYLAESKYDPLASEEIKAQEVKNEYARLAERARRTAKKRELKGNM